MKVGNLGVLDKTKFEVDSETLTFGFMHIFFTQPCLLENISLEFGQKGCFAHGGLWGCVVWGEGR